MAGEYVEFQNNSQPALNENNLNLMQQRIKQDIQGAVSGDTLPIGVIMPFGSDTIPENWLLCNGQAVSRTEYQNLFNTIGTTFGQGDGFTTFNLPNLQGKTIVGKDEDDTDFDMIGKEYGEKNHTMTLEELVPHRHKTWIEDATYAQTGDGYLNYYFGKGRWYNNTTEVGEGQPFNVVQPSIVQNYIIKAKQSSGVVATVVDSLNSSSQIDALSANQGKILNEKFDYSLDEKQIGTWINGKPLYRKVILVDSYPNEGNKAIPIDNVDVMINLKAYATNGTETYYLPSAYNSSNFDSVLYRNDDNAIRIHTSSDRSAYSGYIIAEYTKTTD